MSGIHTQDDPGWPGGRSILGLLPPFGVATTTKGGHGAAVLVMRQILMSIWLSLAGLTVVILFALPGGVEGTDDPVAWVLLGLGGLTALAGGSFARRRPLGCAEPPALAAQYRTTFFLGIAFVQSAALLGFVAAFVIDSAWPYFVALVPTAIGFTLFAPTRGRLETVDRELQAAGCPHSLRAALFGTPDGQQGAPPFG